MGEEAESGSSSQKYWSKKKTKAKLALVFGV